AARLDFRSRRGIDWQRSHRAAARVHAPAGCGACATGAALDRHAIPDGGDRVIEPRSPSTMRNSAETGHRDPLPKGRPMEAHTKVAADGEEDHLFGGSKARGRKLGAGPDDDVDPNIPPEPNYFTSERARPASLLWRMGIVH